MDLKSITVPTGLARAGMTVGSRDEVSPMLFFLIRGMMQP